LTSDGKDEFIMVHYNATCTRFTHDAEKQRDEFLNFNRVSKCDGGIERRSNEDQRCDFIREGENHWVDRSSRELEGGGILALK